MKSFNIETEKKWKNKRKRKKEKKEKRALLWIKSICVGSEYLEIHSPTH